MCTCNIIDIRVKGGIVYFNTRFAKNSFVTVQIFILGSRDYSHWIRSVNITLEQEGGVCV